AGTAEPRHPRAQTGERRVGAELSDEGVVAEPEAAAGAQYDGRGLRAEQRPRKRRRDVAPGGGDRSAAIRRVVQHRSHRATAEPRTRGAEGTCAVYPDGAEVRIWARHRGRTTGARGAALMDDLAGFEERIGYRFCDRDLLTRALTHKSYSHEAKSEAIG